MPLLDMSQVFIHEYHNLGAHAMDFYHSSSLTSIKVTNGIFLKLIYIV